jgi:nicotinamidase/pyrazinamidase
MINEVIIIIDPQKDFTHPDGNYAKRHAGINQILLAKEEINELIKSTDNKKLVVVYSDYAVNQFIENVSMCIPGTFGHEIDITANECRCFSKSQHSAFYSIEFVTYLKSNGVKKLLLCGFLAEYCVQATAIDALYNGFSISLLKEYIGTGDDMQYKKEEMLEKFKNMAIEIIY